MSKPHPLCVPFCLSCPYVTQRMWNVISLNKDHSSVQTPPTLFVCLSVSWNKGFDNLLHVNCVSFSKEQRGQHFTLFVLISCHDAFPWSCDQLCLIRAACSHLAHAVREFPLLLEGLQPMGHHLPVGGEAEYASSKFSPSHPPFWEVVTCS